MMKTDQSDYISICTYYHILSVVLAAIIYFIFAVRTGDFNIKKILVALGMISACFLGTFLYNKILEQDSQSGWLYVVMIVEVFSYGVFIYLSGGFYSPFLWYCIGCLFLPMSININKMLMFSAAIWYLLCTVVNRMNPGYSGTAINLEVNTGIGVVFVIGGFYILASYIQKLNEYQAKMEQALNHITDLYDSFHLFAMSDIDKIMEQLMGIIHRTVAPQGGLLIKLNEDGRPEWQKSMGMTTSISINDKQWPEILSLYGDQYDVMEIGNPPNYSGILIRSLPDLEKSESNMDSFHYRLIDIVFKNIDVQRQLEEYIIGEEQRRIADEIHDTVIQKLFGIACKLKILESELPDTNPQALRSELISLKESVELTMKELRETIYGNRFTEHEKKFKDKLEAYLDGVKGLWDIQINMNVDDDADSLPVSQKLAIYKTVCEAVNNAIRHGEADMVAVSIEINEEGINTVIYDNGIGFNAESVNRRKGEGNGLKNMQRLAKSFKGKCVIESIPGKGTQVVLYVPR